MNRGRMRFVLLKITKLEQKITKRTRIDRNSNTMKNEIYKGETKRKSA